MANYQKYGDNPIDYNNLDDMLLADYGLTMGDTLECAGLDALVLTDQYDATSGWANFDVNGTKTKVYTKYLTGNTYANANSFSAAHGLTSTKIIGLDVLIDGIAGTQGTEVTTAYFDGTKVQADFSSSHSEKPYSFGIHFTE